MFTKNLIILCLFFVWVKKVEATSISSDYINFCNNPQTATMVVVGELVDIDLRSQELIPERGWTAYPSLVPVHSVFSFGLYGKAGTSGGKYLLFIGGKSAKSEGHQQLIPLKKAQRAIAKLATKKDFVGDINPSWQFCLQDNECIQSKNQCNNSIGVNKKYQKDYSSFMKSKKKKVDCSKEVSGKSESKCVESFCS